MFAERFTERAPLLLFIGYLTAVHMIMVGSIRYRLPLEPFLIVFAAAAFTRGSRMKLASEHSDR